MGRRLNQYPEIASHDVVTRAIRSTGADEFGAMTWGTALERLARSLDREAHLTTIARRRVRTELAALLAARVGSPPPHLDPTRPVVIVTGSDRTAVATLERELAASFAGESATATTTATPPASTTATAADRFATQFAALEFEERWHIPAYAEWLSSEPLADVVADVLADAGAKSVGAHSARDRSANERSANERSANERSANERSANERSAGPVVAGAAEFLERLSATLAVAPHAVIVDVDADHLAVTREVTERSTALRRRDDPGADPERIERYWSWRLGALTDAREQSGVPSAFRIDASAVRTDPTTAAAAVRQALGL